MTRTCSTSFFEKGFTLVPRCISVPRSWSVSSLESELIVDRSVNLVTKQNCRSGSYCLNGLFLAAFKGESSTNDELVANGRYICGSLVRRFFSLLGKGDTDSL